MRIVHRGRLFVLCGVVSALLAAVPAMAAIDSYLTLDGIGQNIHLISVVRDTATGMSTGRRMHSTITITKEVDAAAPRFATALATNETLKTVTIVFAGGTGGAKTAKKIVLTNAIISSVRKSGRNEQITFEYQAIEVTWTNGGKTAADDWEAPS